MKNINKASSATRISGAERRHLIVEAAIHLFAKYGFRGATFKQIALAAGVSEASLYQYFSTKAELYALVLAKKAKNVSGDLPGEIIEYARRNDDENLFRAVAEKISGYCRKDSDFLRLTLFSALEGHQQAKPFEGGQMKLIYDLLCGYIKRRQMEKAFQSCNTEEVAKGFIGAQIHRAMTEMLSGNLLTSIPENEPITDFTRLTLDGLRYGANGRKKHAGIF